MGKPYEPRVRMRAKLPTEDFAGISHVARKIIRDYTEALAEYEEIGSTDPRDHDSIENEWLRAKQAMLSYIRRLEADKIVRTRAHNNAVFAKAQDYS